jgi:hypothetical protein
MHCMKLINTTKSIQKPWNVAKNLWNSTRNPQLIIYMNETPVISRIYPYMGSRILHLWGDLHCWNMIHTWAIIWNVGIDLSLQTIPFLAIQIPQMTRKSTSLKRVHWYKCWAHTYIERGGIFFTFSNIHQQSHINCRTWNQNLHGNPFERKPHNFSL